MGHNKTQKAFRTAFDYLERQTVRINGYPTASDYFEQAAAELLRLDEGADTLTRDLLIICFDELERRWKSRDTG